MYSLQLKLTSAYYQLIRIMIKSRRQRYPLQVVVEMMNLLVFRNLEVSYKANDFGYVFNQKLPFYSAILFFSAQRSLSSEPLVLKNSVAAESYRMR